MSIDGPPEIEVSEDATVTVTSVVANTGDAPVSAHDVLSVAPPFDCEVDPPQYTDDIELDPDEQATIVHEFTVHCFEYSNHQFEFCNVIGTIDTGFQDPTPGNNRLCENYIVVAYAETDVKTTGVSVDAPALAQAGEPFDVTVSATIHNNGPISPLEGEGGLGLAVPPGCTRDPDVTFQLVNPINLPMSVTVTIEKTWSITCAEPGIYNFVACGRAGPLTEHVRDSDRYNNFRYIEFTVEVGELGPDPLAGRCSILGDPPEVCGNGIDEDLDGQIDEEPDIDRDGISDCDDPDDDGDEYADTVEQYIGTEPEDPCANHYQDTAWPPDFNNDRSVSITDILTFRGPFGTSAGSSAYSERTDLDANGVINISDILRLKPDFGTACN
jgi:hypothetical protein